MSRRVIGLVMIGAGIGGLAATSPWWWLLLPPLFVAVWLRRPDA